MKCLNMDIPGVLFFLVSFIAIHSADVRPNKPSRTQLDDDIIIKNLYKNCPHILEIINVSNSTDYTINCKPFVAEDATIHIETVLKKACLLVKTILNLMCESRLDVSFHLFKRTNDSVCPFNFSYLEYRFNISVDRFVKELTKRDKCEKICLDLYEVRPQCSVLSKFSIPKSLNQFSNVTSPKIIEPGQVRITQSESGAVSTTPEKNQESRKNDSVADKAILSKPNSVKIVKSSSLLDQKVEVNQIQTNLPKQNELDIKHLKEEKPFEKPETKSMPHMNELPKSDIKYNNANERLDSEIENNNANELHKSETKTDINEKLDDQEGIDDDINPTEDVKPDVKLDVSLASNIQDLESSENKFDSLPSRKEIYAGEGFFQAEDSHFFFYFIMISSIIVVGYLAFHNKNKILAYALEGSSGRRSRRRPNPARYRKLETNLEEVISSNATNTAASSVVY